MFWKTSWSFLKISFILNLSYLFIFHNALSFVFQNKKNVHVSFMSIQIIFSFIMSCMSKFYYTHFMSLLSLFRLVCIYIKPDLHFFHKYLRRKKSQMKIVKAWVQVKQVKYAVHKQKYNIRKHKNTVKETKHSKFSKREIRLKKVEKRMFYVKVATCSGLPPTYDSNRKCTRRKNKMSPVNTMNEYEIGQEMAGENKN